MQSLKICKDKNPIINDHQRLTEEEFVHADIQIHRN